MVKKLASKFTQSLKEIISMTTSERLFALANSPDRKIGEEIAGNPNTTVETLEKLIQNEYEKKQSPLFYHRIIHHPNSSADIIDAVLRKCRYGSIQKSALNCVKTSAKNLIRFAHDKGMISNPHLYELLVKHPHVSPEIITIAQIIGNHQTITPEVLIEFAGHSNYAQAVFQHQNMSAEMLAQLSLSDIKAVRISVAEHPKTAVSTLKYLTQDENKFVRETIARRNNIPEEISAILADDPCESVRVLVAKIENLTPETISKLGRDPEEAVRCILIEHHNCLIDLSPETLLQLAGDKSQFVRANVAGYQKLSAELIELFAFDSSLRVRHALVGKCNLNMNSYLLFRIRIRHALVSKRNLNMNSHLPFDILWKMLEQSEAFLNLESSPPLTEVDGQEISVGYNEPLSEQVVNVSIKIALTEHPETTLDFLHSLLSDEDSDIRAAAASNPKLSATTLDRLLDDESLRVRVAVLVNPSVSSDTLRRFLEHQNNRMYKGEEGCTIPMLIQAATAELNRRGES